MKMKINFKDSVFTTLFNNPDLLRELYCALEGVSLPKDAPVTINTLENALVMGIYNDISFEIAGKLVILIEHQSSIGGSLALRFLIYISEIYERMIKDKNIYSEKSVSIPWPEFFVLYNGQKEYPSDNFVIRLSDLFEKPQDLGLPEKVHPLLELEVKVININEGRNEEIVRRCSKLQEYSVFMARIYEYKEMYGSLEKAVKNAVKYCKEYGILDEYLSVHGAEVENMLYTEFNIDVAKKVWWEDGWEDGHIQGHAQGCEEERKTIARNLLVKGSSLEFVHEITGLSLEEINNLK